MTQYDSVEADDTSECWMERTAKGEDTEPLVAEWI